ncbi:putative Zn-dependent peptidase [Chitinophaga skermanii]|uniref:Putative Zn-dependent peptidase n=1 Tax=Chitinophaga skermanii TaxID=331697 RepID=A0A327QJM3_9BACT|nr:M16 family metallopeptidase [Chitinophaga skermanii]RAJ03842.1 putative Zn-dependent peptidase [Chitinophaga skermanii]
MRVLKLFLLLVVAGNATFAQSKYEWKEGNAGGYTYKYVTNDPMQARFYTLKNGLTVILSVNKKEPRIQTLIGVRAGSTSDPADHTGLAHYLEHLLFKGTDKYGSLDWAKEKPYLDQIEGLYDVYNQTTDVAKRKAIYRQIDSVSGIAAKYAIANEYDKMMTAMGAQGTNAHTSNEETVYEEDIPSNAVDKFLTLQAERFRNPQFRIFHTELEAVYEEKNRGLDNDNNKMYETLFAALFPTHNYGQQTTIGTIEHLKNPSLKAIRKFYDTYYVPNNMSIVMAGDFDPDYVIKKIDEKFSYMQPKPVTEYTAAPEKAITAPIVKEVIGPDAESVNIAFRLPGAEDTKTRLLIAALAQVLTNGSAGLMDLNLNKQQKLLSASAGDYGLKDYTVLFLAGKAKEGQTLEDVRDLLLGQLEILKKGQFDETLIKAIVNNYKLAEIQGLESNNNRATSIMDNYIKSAGKTWAADVAYIDDLSKISKQQIVDFANKNLNNNYVIVYKRKGEDKSTEKVEKPPITPVEVNRDAQSAFLKSIFEMPATPVKPQWLDFNKDIQKGKVGAADVLYVQNKENGLFRLYYKFDMGSWNNKLLPLAATYLSFLGTDKMSAEEITKQFYNIACSFKVSAGSDESSIVISGLNENFDQAVKLFEDLIRNCKVDENAFAALKSRINKSRTDAKLNKGQIMNALTYYGMYGAKNPFNNTLSKADLESLKAQTLVDLLHSLPNFKPTIIYYGPKPLATLTADVKRLHPMPATFATPPAATKFEQVHNTKGNVLFTDYNMVQSEVRWVYNDTKYDPKETAIVELFNAYFGGGMGSIVFQTIRESKALAYSTYAYYSSPNKKELSYTTMAYVGSQADKMNEAIAGMNELLTDIPRSDKALITAKASMKQDIETQRVTQDGIIANYLNAKKLGLDYDLRKDVYNAIDNMNFEQVKAFHAKHIAGKPYTYCVLASDKRVSEEDLKKYGDVKKLSLEELFGY